MFYYRVQLDKIGQFVSNKACIVCGLDRNTQPRKHVFRFRSSGRTLKLLEKYSSRYFDAASDDVMVCIPLCDTCRMKRMFFTWLSRLPFAALCITVLLMIYSGKGNTLLGLHPALAIITIGTPLAVLTWYIDRFYYNRTFNFHDLTGSYFSLILGNPVAAKKLSGGTLFFERGGIISVNPVVENGVRVMEEYLYSKPYTTISGLLKKNVYYDSLQNINREEHFYSEAFEKEKKYSRAETIYNTRDGSIARFYYSGNNRRINID